VTASSLHFNAAAMSTIDRQRITAVRTLERLGYVFDGMDWAAPVQAGPSMVAADRLHALLILRADQLEGCTEGSPEAADLAVIVEAIEAYEAIRWPDGKVPGGKG
jgi:hypothetical protein